ncbi:hypothetical protein EU546_03870 [Candidatus Thorarchaeota archaeon]|nr:MAG: hypothetical protein EU546_03870 [Candidatus Thorarchaeota archaeon]
MEEKDEYRELRECPFRKERCVADACMFWTAIDEGSGFCNFNAMEDSIKTISNATACIAVMLLILILMILSRPW